MATDTYQLAQAIRAGNIDEINRLLLLIFSDMDLNQALVKASKMMPIEIVNYLLQAGADPNIPADNQYALVHAVKRGDRRIVRLLLEAGANVHVQDDQLLLWAIIGQGQRYDPDSQLKMVRLLLEAGANVHADNDLAIREVGFHSQDIRLYQLLLDAGADIHAGNDVPLALAINQSSLPLVQFLLDAGANANAIEETGNPLSHVIANVEDETIRFNMVYALLQAGANVNTLPVVFQASEMGYDDIVELLLEFCPDTNWIPDSARSVIERDHEMNMRDLYMYTQMGDPYFTTLTDCRRSRLRKSLDRLHR